MLLSNSTNAQEEYDDMYFTPRDRKEVKTESVYAPNNKDKAEIEENRDVINPSSSTQLYGNAQENYSSKNVNPEYIERYKSNSKDSASREPLADGDSYYIENYDRSDFKEENARNQSYSQYGYPGSYPGSNYGYNDPFYSGYNSFYSGYNSFHSGYNYYGRSFYDPFWNPYYGPGWGFTPGFSMSLSFGSGWGYNPWYAPYGGYMGYSRPWYSSYYYSPWAYDPWYGPYSRWGLAYYPGYYSNRYYYVGTGNENISPYNRRVSRGADNYIVTNNAAPNRRTATVNQQKVTDGENINSRARTERDYSRSQNEYYARSRARYDNTTSTNNSNISSSRSGNTVGTTSTPRVRTSRNDVEYSRPTYRNNTGSRSGTSTYNRSTDRSSWSNSGYQRSRSDNNSYSSPSRSNSSYSNRSYNSGSSSGYSGGSSAPSRSSGSSESNSRSGGRR
ncbi:MAG: hypothetical protein KFF73_03635 [Cyclobacteriaceae bacterium]|nr:hypothetical protein [Cyclobacteriaceae bacterium]